MCRNHLIAAILCASGLLAGIPSASGAVSKDWKCSVPVPVFDREPGYVELYWKAWELAHEQIKEQNGLPQPRYIDEAFWDDTIWIWDTCFMVMFCKYAPDEFPGVESLNNFYFPLHDPSVEKGTFPLNIQHPDNPPLFAWVEYENFMVTGDRAHAVNLLIGTKYLQKHYKWFDKAPTGWRFYSKAQRRKKSVPVRLKKTENGFQWSGVQSGMDNTPRKGGLWIDAISQQALSALYISRMAEQIGQTEIAESWNETYQEIKDQVNELYWNEEDGIYYDVDPSTGRHLKVKTPASYWAMLAELCSPEQAGKMVEHIRNPEAFGGERPWVTVARSDPGFTTPDGNYWRGGIWLPTAYMGTKALEKYGYFDEADEAAERLLSHMLRTYEGYKPSSIWECYSPTRDTPADHNGKLVRPDFCGWSALGPISLFIENVLGFHVIDAPGKKIEWRLHQDGRHGIRNLKFGHIVTDILFDGERTVTVKSSAPYTLVINERKHRIESGLTTIDTERE
ncbi:MGH1-like glycoside hydrolase domain-containing protein [Pontiella agarivorans]|uniref:Trehalase family glycosidase n=1 Tax=Pontiella agarivorans TaxID=3038953 RepID=A0ABU5MY66_9BACT|nr:trehalase family glycosidase [Pontiella agarivorans]MDZ8119114.1 trehalase family glycosidase [Pontiella agarivorans]